MAITEQSRHALHQRLDETLGPEEATTLMEHLPPVGWADVATKTDLAHLEERLKGHIALQGETIRKEFHDAFGTYRDALAKDRSDNQRTLLYAVVGMVLSVLSSLGVFALLGWS